MGYILDKNKTQQTIIKEIDGNGDGTTTVDVKAGTYVVGITLKPTADEIVNVSDVVLGGIDIEENFELTANISSVIAINKKYDTAATIYIDNLNEKLTVTLYYL